MRSNPGCWIATLLVLQVSIGFADASVLPERRAVAITDVTVIDLEHGRSSGARTVFVNDGRIVGVVASRDARIPKDTSRVDGRGKFLLPGLVDMHVHLFNRHSKRPPNEWSFPLFVANGVTAIREMNADAASMLIVKEWRQRSAAGDLVGPRIVSAGVAVLGRSPEDAIDQVNAAADAGADFIKVFSEVPKSHWSAILKAAQARALPVEGHVPADVRFIEAAVAGQRTNEHLMQAFEACSSLEERLLTTRQGLERDALVALRDEQEAQALDTFDPKICRQIAQKLAATGQVQVPTLMLPYVESLQPVNQLSDDPRWQYLRKDERERWERLLASVVPNEDLAARRWLVTRQIVSAFHRANVPILAGTDTPMPRVYPGFSLHEELALLVEAGLTPREALLSATLGPARFLGEEEKTGSIAAGKRADLLLLDADPTRDISNTRRIHAVMIDGRLLDRAALDEMLARARG